MLYALFTTSNIAFVVNTKISIYSITDGHSEFWGTYGGFALFSCTINCPLLCLISVERYRLIRNAWDSITSSPKPDALPGCATPRVVFLYNNYLSFQQMKEIENDTKYEHL